jgi:hypothetical protein
MSGFGLGSSKRALFLLLLYAGHDLALSEFRDILLVHIVFWTGNSLFGTIHP